MLRKRVHRYSQMAASPSFKILTLPVVVAIGLIALGAPAHSQPCHTPNADVKICCFDLDDGGPSECSVRELSQNTGGSVTVDNLSMTVNTFPFNVADDRVFVTGIGEGTGRPGLKFEVRDAALVGDACFSMFDWYQFGLVAFAASRAQPSGIVDVTLTVDYSDVHTGSGPDFDGAYLSGFMINTPFFPPDLRVDFFTPEAAAGNLIEPPPSGADTLPATLEFCCPTTKTGDSACEERDVRTCDDPPLGFEDVRIDMSQIGIFGALCGQLTQLNGWTVTFGVVLLPTPTPMETGTPTATGMPTATATPTVEGQVCTADCSGDNVVAINELVTCVGIVLGNTGPDACPACDGNGDGSVGIADLIGGVGNLLTGCA